uniref:TARBP2 subunit of RISC loading complex n=1 Tax=Dromaius novaehollandiae TaxID=8790 RepID=A0A8C4JIP8_DRONO
MLASNPGKTPISLLQEYGTRIGKTPGYDLLKAEGQAHQPNFTFRVTVGDVSCTGSGTSKKLAKRNAAAKMLVRIHNVPMEPREGSEAEVEEDQFSMVRGAGTPKAGLGGVNGGHGPPKTSLGG